MSRLVSDTLVVAERMRALVEETTRDADVRVTVSIGAVAHRGAGVTAETLIAVADRAAYQAKASGRNAIAAAPPPAPPPARAPTPSAARPSRARASG